VQHFGHARSVVGEYQLGERRRSARPVSVMRPGTRPRRLGGNIHGGSYWSRGLKCGEVGKRARSGRTTEGTMLEIRLALRMVVMAVVGRCAAVRRAELHQERAAARGHESHRDICAKQKRGQQYDGQPIGSPDVTEPSFHDLGEPPCQSERRCSSRQRGPGTCSQRRRMQVDLSVQRA
jgi:hypothetical protein